MNLLGVRLNVLIGPDPIAAPPPLTALEALREVEVTESEREPSGFRMTFAIGRSGPLELIDHPLIATPLLSVNSRVILSAIFDIRLVVIMDGIVTERHVVAGDRPGEGQLILTGRDISAAMDRDVKKVEHPAQDETIIATKIAASYAKYGLVPNVIPPIFLDPPIPVDRTPQQQCSDWQYLQRMAGRHGYVTFVEPGPVPFANRLYWGPPAGFGIPQKAISVNLGTETNVTGFTTAHKGDATVTVEGAVKDRLTGKTLPVIAIVPTRPPLGLLPEGLTNLTSSRTRSIRTSGLNLAQALGRAQSMVDLESDGGISAQGTLDCLKYNGVLRARYPVDVRGAGFSFDGSYMVRSVTHHITTGKYTQDFTLGRGELGAKLPLVRVS